MRRELAIEFSRATEAAALAGYKWLGRGDKNAAELLACENVDGGLIGGASLKAPDFGVIIDAAQ